MSIRVPWEDQYAFVTQVDGVYGYPLFDRSLVLNPYSGGFGAKQDVFGWDVIGHPDLGNNQQVIDTRKAYGIAQRYSLSGSKEFQQGVFQAGGSFECHGHAGMISPWMWAFVQTGASQAPATGTADNTVYTFIPPTTSTIEVVNNVVRKMSASAGNSHRLGGCIPRQIQFVANENEALRMVMELVAYDHVATVDWSSLPSITYDTTNVLLWQNSTVTLGGETILCPGIDVTLNNNAVTKFYDNAYAQRFALGDYVLTGTIMVPWDAHPAGYTPGADQGANQQLTDFAAGADKLLVVTWGGATEDNYFQMSMNVRYTGASVEEQEGELGWSLPFMGVYDGTNHSFQFKTCEANTNRGIPA